MLTDICQPFFLTKEDFSEAVLSNCAVILATTASSRLHSRSLYLLSNLERLCVRCCLCWYIQKLYDQDRIWTTVFGWRTVDYFAIAQLPWLWHTLTYKRSNHPSHRAQSGQYDTWWPKWYCATVQNRWHNHGLGWRCLHDHNTVAHGDAGSCWHAWRILANVVL